MNDMRKTKAQLVEELTALREELARRRPPAKHEAVPDRAWLSTLVDQMVEPTVMIDWEGNLVHGNALAAGVLGLDDPAQLPGINIAGILHPSSIEQAAIDLAQVKESTAPFAASYKLLVNGRTVPIESHGTKIELADGSVDLVSFQNVSAQQRTVRELQHQEGLFKSMVENANDIIYTIHTDGTLRYVSPNWKSMLGHEPEEVIGTSFMPYIHPEDLPACLAFLEQVMASGTKHEGMEYRVQHKDGSWRWHMSNASTMVTPEGETIFAGIARDISERKQMETELREGRRLLEERVRERTRELEQVNRMLHEEVAEREATAEELEIFQKFADASGQGFGMADLDGRITYINQAVCRFIGFDHPGEGLGRHLSEFHPEEVRQQLIEEVVPTVLEQGEWVGEMPMLNVDGTSVPTILSMFLLRDEQGLPQQFAAVLTDIRERKQSEEAIEESERKFRSLAESTTAHISIIQDDTYVYANQAFLDYFEIEPEDLPMIIPEDMMMGMMTPKTVEQAKSAWEAATERGDTRFRFEYRDVDGNWFQTYVAVMELDDKPSVLVTNIDITEIKRAQEELKEGEERYRTIFDTAGTGMISFGQDGVITLANEEWTKLSGYSIAETVGKMSWMPFFTEDSLTRMRKYHELRSKDPSSAPRAYEAQFVDRQGKIHDGIINIQIVPGTQQRVASFQDLTELKRAQREMYRADKMAALGQIIAGVAHEINNPNNFIYFNLPILKKYIEAIRPMLEHHLVDDPDLRILNMPYEDFLADVFKLLENMEHGSQRITGIVSELKTYVRSDEERETKTGTVGPVIERVMALVGKQVRKMVKRFEVEVADDLPELSMNPGKIEQLLINLVINAGQAADKEDSWVKLTARPDTQRGADWIEILVEDNGTGIPEEIRNQIFEPFFTSKGRETGTGLGLSICHRIVEEHGGSIGVESTPGQGTTFTIHLPA